MVFFIFNGVGLIISVSAIAVIVHGTGKVAEAVKLKMLSLVKGFVLIALSFLWTLFFGHLIMPSSFLNVQAVILSFGMAMLVYSANKLFEIKEKASE